MKNPYRIAAVLALALAVSGCAGIPSGPWSQQPICSIVGGAIGAGLGAAVANDELTGAAGGGVASAVLAAMICGASDSDGDGVPDSADKCPGTPTGVKVDASGCPLDSDGDGVPDNADKCPGTPTGVKVDASGCPLDSDGDGVPDNADKCPGTPKGTRVDGTGCPLDSDHDGVTDNLDQCPDTLAGQKVDSNGCPEILITLTGVNFASDSASIEKDSGNILDQAVAALNKAGAVSVRVEGHTDSRGSDAYNLKLSQRRAEAVKAYLASHGIAASRLTTAGRGESQPVASNDTDAGRYQNRRVELHVEHGGAMAAPPSSGGAESWRGLDQPVTHH